MILVVQINNKMANSTESEMPEALLFRFRFSIKPNKTQFEKKETEKCKKKTQLWQKEQRKGEQKIDRNGERLETLHQKSF